MDDGFVVVSVQRRTSWSTPGKELVRVLHSVNWLCWSFVSIVQWMFFFGIPPLHSFNYCCVVWIQCKINISLVRKMLFHWWKSAAILVIGWEGLEFQKGGFGSLLATLIIFFASANLMLMYFIYPLVRSSFTCGISNFMWEDYVDYDLLAFIHHQCSSIKILHLWLMKVDTQRSNSLCCYSGKIRGPRLN